MKRVMQKFIILTLAGLLGMTFISCGGTEAAPTWQEQYDLGVRYLSEGNYEEAIIAFTAAIEIDPKQADAYIGRGDAYIHLDATEANIASALADYLMAIELGSEPEDVYARLVTLYIQIGDYDEAAKYINRVGDIGLSNMFGEAYLSNRYQELVQQYGLASIETMERRVTSFADYGWTNRRGILSKIIQDIDDDGMPEMVLIRTDTSDENYGTDVLVDIYSIQNGAIVSDTYHPSITFNDAEYLYLTVYLLELGGQTYICIEECPRGILVDYSDNHYVLLQYSNKTLWKKMELGQSAGGTSDIGYSLYVWDEFGNCNETVLYTGSEWAADDLGSVGKYNGADNYVVSGLLEFGFPEPQQYYEDYFPTYFNYISNTKLCLIESRLKDDDWLNGVVQCIVADYTGIHDNDIDSIEATDDITEAETPSTTYVESYKDMLQQYPEYTDESLGKRYTEYMLYDIDKNDIPELIVKRSDIWNYAIYTFDGQNSVSCGEIWDSYLGNYAELYAYDGNGIIIHGGGMGSMRIEHVYTQQLIDNTLTEGTSVSGSTEDISFEELYSLLEPYTLLNNFFRISDYTPFDA